MPRVGVPQVDVSIFMMYLWNSDTKSGKKMLECLRSLYVVILISVQMLGMS